MKISPKLIEQNLEKIFKIKKKLKTLRYIKQKQYINEMMGLPREPGRKYVEVIVKNIIANFSEMKSTCNRITDA